MGIRQEALINNQTFSATVTGSAITNDGRAAWVLTSVVGAMTTTPTLTVRLDGSFDGTTWFTIDTQTVINAANGVQRTVYAIGSSKGPILEPYLRVVATFGGTGNFANTIVALLGATCSN